MAKVLKIYKNLAQTPILTGAKFLQDEIITTFWTQRNIETGKNIKYMKTHFYERNIDAFLDVMPTDISQEALMSFSPVGKKRAVLREIPDGKESTKKQYLEVWTNDFLSHSVDLAALNLHGDVYTDGEFKSWVWSPDGTKILYIAEKKSPKTEPFYKRKPEKSIDGNGDASSITVGEEYTFRQDWGEQLIGKVISVIAMYDLEEDKVKILEGVPEYLCPGQVSWAPDGLSVIGVAWETQPRKLGLIYCSNRDGSVFRLDLQGNYVNLSSEKRAVSSPKYSPDGKYIIWLERDTGGPHHACHRLMRLNIIQTTAKPEVVVDIVKKVVETSNNENFYGLFNAKLPERCWASKNRIIFSTNQKYTTKSYVVSIESGEITELKSDKSSQIILDVYNDNILVSQENYLQIAQCFIGYLPETGKEATLKWKNVTKLQEIDLLKNMTYEFLDLKHDNNDEINEFNAIYYGPETGEKNTVPLILWPHGGPHSAFYTTFVFEPSLLLSLGFAIVFINYRGSIGQGDSSVRFLPGRVGTADVEDCILAAKETIARFPWINQDELGLVGGSHGGFLVHHLSGQYPEMFKAVVSRNPVIDVATMSLISDIPDWCAVEAGSSYTQKGPVDNNLLLKMRQCSPIQHAHKIKAPTYLMLGSKDLRVPCSQGLELLYRLKSNGVKVKASMYDDNHPLAQLPNEMDHIINGALWLLEHVKNERI